MPLIPLRLLRRPWLLAANGAVLLILAAGMGFQFVNTLFLQQVMGFDALRTGLAFLPTPVVIGVVSLFLAARLTSRFGPRRVLLGGLGGLAAGLLLLARVPVGASFAVDVLPALLVMGVGVGVTVPAIMMLAMAGASDEDMGLVSGLNNTAQQAGAALGLAVLAAVAAGRTGAGDGVGCAPGRVQPGVPGGRCVCGGSGGGCGDGVAEAAGFGGWREGVFGRGCWWRWLVRRGCCWRWLFRGGLWAL